MKAFRVFAVLLVVPGAAWAQTTEPAAEEKPAAEAKPAAAETKPAAAEEKDASADDYHEGEIELGFQQKDVSTVSSKFEEYRDVPNGITIPAVRFAGRKGDLRYAFLGDRLRQDDQRYVLRVWNPGFELRGDYLQIPHNFGNDGHTILQQTGPGTWALSDALQQYHQDAIAALPSDQITYPNLNALLAPSLATAHPVDLALERQRSNLAVHATPTPALDLSVSYFHERRTGSRSASGTSFGFSNVVELPEPLHYLTQDIGAEGEYTGGWGSVRAGLHYNWFQDSIDSLAFDNPWRATDATDPSAYQAPGSKSINGPTTGRVALPPDNDALTGSVSATFKLPAHSRLNVSASRARWNQNETPFLPYSTNTSIVTPVVATDLSTLPAQQLAGQIDVTSLSGTFNAPLTDRLHLNARYRSYEQANQTPRLTFPGYVVFDGNWSDTGRISVPYGFKNARFDGGLDYDIGPATVEAGYRYVKMDRTYRETDSTSENTLVLATDVRPTEWALLRASYEHGSRGYDGYHPERSEDSSFVTPGSPTNLFALPGNLRYDQAPRDQDQILATLQLTGDTTMLSATYGRHKDNYKDQQFGLIDASFDTFTLEAGYQPSARLDVNAFWTWEKLDNFQRGRQSGSSPSTNPLDDWTSTVGDTSQSLGADLAYTIAPEHWFVTLSGWYQDVNGDNALFAAPGGAPANARPGGVQSLPLYDDTRIVSLNAELRDEFAKHWSAAVGAWYENYEIQDSNAQGLVNYVPGSLFLAANDGDYRAWVGYIRVTTRF